MVKLKSGRLTGVKKTITKRSGIYGRRMTCVELQKPALIVSLVKEGRN